jgi:hypothetical protein
MADLSFEPPSRPENPMNPDRETEGAWAEAARQLREFREEQQRTWGNLDSSTLGRYLADEVDAAERARVEAEMDAHPELARLTDLVRDVLADFQPDEVPAPVVPAPAILTPAPEPEPHVLPFAPRPRQSFFVRYRQHIALAAAACVLFVLGWNFFDSAARHVAGPVVPVALHEPPLDTLGNNVVAVASLKPLEQLDRQLAAEQAAPNKTTDAVAFDTAYRQWSEKNGELGNSTRFAESLERLGNFLEGQGHLARAEQNYQQSYSIRAQKCGQNSPETLRAASNLANVYQLALNTPYYEGAERGGGVLLLSGPKNPYTQGTGLTNPYLDPTVRTSPSVPAPAPLGSEAVVNTSAKFQSDREAGLFKKDLRDVQSRLVAQSPEEVRKSVVPVLVEALRHATPEKRVSLMQALGNLGPAAREATPLFLERLKVGNKEEKVAAVQALGRVGAGVTGVSNRLSELVLQQPDIGLIAGNSLLALGPDGRRAIEELAREEPLLRKRAAELRHEGQKGGLARDLDARASVIDQIQQLSTAPTSRTGLLDVACVFTPHTLMVARHHIDLLSREPSRQVFIETLRQAPTEPAVGERARLLGTQGLYVLIVTDPAGVQLSVGEPLRQAGFSEARERELSESLRTLVTAKKYDEMPALILSALPKHSPIKPVDNP